MTSHRFALAGTLLALLVPAAAADPLPKVRGVELQPLAAQAKRIADALDLLGAPLSDADKKALADAANDKDHARAVDVIQDVLDRRCLAGVRIDALDKAAAVKLARALAGPAKPELAEQGWRVFLVKVQNPQGLDKVELRAESPNSLPLT